MCGKAEPMTVIGTKTRYPMVLEALGSREDVCKSAFAERFRTIESFGHPVFTAAGCGHAWYEDLSAAKAFSVRATPLSLAILGPSPAKSSSSSPV